MSTETPTILKTAPAPVAFHLSASSAVSGDTREVRWPELAKAAVDHKWSVDAESNYSGEKHRATVVYRTTETVVVLFEFFSWWEKDGGTKRKDTAKLQAFSL